MLCRLFCLVILVTSALRADLASPRCPQFRCPRPSLLHYSRPSHPLGHPLCYPFALLNDFHSISTRAITTLWISRRLDQLPMSAVPEPAEETATLKAPTGHDKTAPVEKMSVSKVSQSQGADDVPIRSVPHPHTAASQQAVRIH